MNTRWNITVVALVLLATLAGFGYVLSIWSVGYSPRWTPDEDVFMKPGERHFFPDISAEGQFRLLISESHGKRSVITVTPAEAGAEVSAETYYWSAGVPRLLESFGRTISQAMYEDFVRQVYAIGVFDRDPTEDVPVYWTDGTTVSFLSIAKNQYIWFEHNAHIPELAALEILFRSVCGERCNEGFLGGHERLEWLRKQQPLRLLSQTRE